MTSFITSHLSITNRIEEGVLCCYNTMQENQLLQILIQQVFSRVVGLLISFGALLEIVLHTCILPFAVIYCIGKSIFVKRDDFMIPWQHLQRIRDAVFPLLFGSLFGLIHPYLGVYATEPVKKHIATGILLSGTNKVQFDAVCSPLTTMSEIASFFSQLPPDLAISQEEMDLLDQVIYWEGEFEKIQSIDFFNLNVTFKLGSMIQEAIEESDIPFVREGLAKRVALITYPIFAFMDMAVYMFATIVSLGTLVVKVMGGQSPAYLEKAWTPEVLIYNVVKMPLFLISATIGFIVSIVHPKTGLLCAKYPLEWMAKVPFMIKMERLKSHLSAMREGELLLLPAVQTYPDDQRGELSLLPSYGSHMRFLLIEKIGEDLFEGELIDRKNRHGKTAHLSQQDMEDVMQKTLAQRYKFGYNEQENFLDAFYVQDDTMIKLGNQMGINNCGVTNLFAAIQVLHDRLNNPNFVVACQHIRWQATRRYYMYGRDYYPFGRTSEVLKEINARSKIHI